MSTHHRRSAHQKLIDELVHQLLAEIANLIRDLLNDAYAGERPHVSLKGVLDAVNRIQIEAGRS
jgi:hypothetical protein